MTLPTADHSLPLTLSDLPGNTQTLEKSPLARLSKMHSNTSLTSQYSFATAISSPPSPGIPSEAPSASSSPMLPPQSLRKSLSVDSLVRNDVPRSATRTKRTNTELAMPNPALPLQGSHDYEHRALQEATRTRGISLSTEGGYEHSIAEDSDLEPWPTSRRRQSLKGKDQYPPGELKLPPRMPALSSASSISSMSTAPSSPREEYRRLHATTSMQSIPTRMKNPVLSNIASGRARSGSLGVKVAGRPSFINIPSQPLEESVDPVTIAVVGAHGAGKSVVIRKGAKQFGLSEQTVHSAPPGMLGVQTPLRYVRRIGMVTDIEILGEMTPTCPLHILEIDIAHLEWDDSSTVANNDTSMSTPQVHGVLVCYDATSQSSFTHVEDLLKRLHLLKLPFMVLACKSDLERRVDPKLALVLLKQYDSGLVEATKESETGKDRMRKSFEWLVKAILRERSRNIQYPDYRNPASPDALVSLPPWDLLQKSRSSTDSSTLTTLTASASTSMSSMRTIANSQAGSSKFQQTTAMPTMSSPRSPSAPASPTRARSHNDIQSEHERSKNQIHSLDVAPSGRDIMNMSSVSSEHFGLSGTMPGDVLSGADDTKEPELKQSRPVQWATLDELLDKLLFLAVSGDDPAFISNFLLTYRRFATPRSVVLAMQKRMLSLDDNAGDPMFACFAQMRICNLLELWKESYPHDFAVRGTAGALSAMVTQIIKKTYLLHYGSDFLPFTEMLGQYEDTDGAWALPVEAPADDDEEEEPYSFEGEEIAAPQRESPATSVADDHSSTGHRPPSIVVLNSRERKSSLPLSTLSSGADGIPKLFPSEDAEFKRLLKDLLRNSTELSNFDSAHIAEEITRIEAEYFLAIKPRDWLNYTLVSGKKVPEQDPIARFNEFSEYLATWVVSLILCHDRPKHRARQIEKLVDIASKLRGHNNYSALRAFVAGISNSTFEGDAAMELFRTKTPELYKTFKSWDILFQAIRSHRAYRMALKSSKGACIPAMEVHMSDLIRAHEGNKETSPDHPGKIHWGKFNMIGKFVASTTQCQVQCRTSSEYNFQPKDHIRKWIAQPAFLMTGEMQKSRIAPMPDEPIEEPHRIHLPRTYSRDVPNTSQTRDASNIVRKLFSW